LRKRLAHGAQNQCFGCGTDNAEGLHLEFEAEGDGTVFCKITISPRFQGPADHVHGGIIATLLDEVMSKGNRVLGVTAMTRHMEVEYLRPVPLATPILLKGRNVRFEGRKYWCEGEIQDIEGKVLAKSKALFIAVNHQDN
jgi:uncharacterized protein (TIGR00369 family)